MTVGAAITLSIFYLLLLLLAAQSLHRLSLAIRALRRPADTASIRIEDSDTPRLLVQLPVYNEPKVIERALRACAALDYPEGQLHIQVLDDSTDETSAIVDRTLEELSRGRHSFSVLRRDGRDGFKAGALSAGMEASDEPFVAIFDADFVPPIDFALQLMGEFRDPRVGMVQAKWTHLNRDRSLLTRAQGALLDGHFSVEQQSRASAGHFFNFNGTAGIWRRAAIADAGGWHGDTLTEDFDLSYRAQLRGWRFVFRPDVQVPAELPATIGGYRSQQHRWAKGGTETFLKLCRALFHVPIGGRKRLEGLLHLLANLNYMWVALVAVLMPLAVHAHARGPQPLLGMLDTVLIATTLVSMAGFYGVAAARSGRPFRHALVDSLLAVALDVGISIRKAKGVVEAFVRHRSAFVRTPKDGSQSGLPVERHARNVPQRAVVRFRDLISSWVAEAVVAAWLCFGTYAAVVSFEISALAIPFLVFFAVSLGYVAIESLVESARVFRVTAPVLSGRSRETATRPEQTAELLQKPPRHISIDSACASQLLLDDNAEVAAPTHFQAAPSAPNSSTGR